MGKAVKFLLALFALGVGFTASPALAVDCSGAAIPGMVVGTDGTNCYYIKVNSDGSINTSGGSGGNVTVINPLGSQPAATSVSVAVASDQINLPIPAGTNLIGGTTPTASATLGGLTFATLTAANSTNATNLKGTPGQLYHISGYSAAAVPTWVTFYNNSGTPTCGTNIVYEVLIPVNSTSGGGFIEDIPMGLTFSTGIAFCITTGIGGTGSVAATSIVLNSGYK